MTNYELKIGYCEKWNIQKRTVVRKLNFRAATLNNAKVRATNELKQLSEMEKYLKDRYGRTIRWSVWRKETQHETGGWFTNKQSDGILDSPQTIGFVQLMWDKKQIPLF